MYADINGVKICLNEPPQNPLHRDVLLICDCVFCDCVFCDCVFCDCVFCDCVFFDCVFVTVCFVTVCFVQRVIDDYVFCDSMFSSILFNRPGLLNGILFFFIYLFIKCIQPKVMTLNYFRICFFVTNKSTLYNPSMYCQFFPIFTPC